MIKLIKMLSGLFVSGSMVLIAGAFYIYAVLVPELPSIEHLEDAQLQVPLRVYDRNEALLAEYGEHRRIPVTFEDIPSDIIEAFISAEDDQFWEHFGVDPLALAAAAYELVTTGNKTRGGSTITMQVARNFFLSSKKTYSRKLNEILLALKIEGEFSKEKILELYVNKIYLGHRAYGIVAASQIYYNKSLDELTLAQAAMIAGLPKAPSKYNPVRNPERALIRRNHILNRMRVLGYIDEESYDLARVEPVTAELHSTQTIADAQYVAELVRARLFEEYGEDAYKTGLKAYTTIDGQLQAVANRSLRQTLLDYVRRHGYRGAIKSIDLDSIEEDPFDAELVSDKAVGNLQQAVITEIGEMSARALITNYEIIEIPFEKGLNWAAQFIDVDHQSKKPEAVSDVLNIGDVIWVEKRAGNQWLLGDIPKIEGALVSVNSRDGAINALVGGFDFFKNKFNRATQARRQPGSNFKPFIYSAALEKGFTAASIVNDAPVVFDDDSLEATWRPENYSGKFYGPTRFREALVKSRNLVSIRILQAIGLRYATSYARRFGFKKENMPYDLSLALGSGTFTPLEIATAYSVFSNGGFLIEPYYLSRLESGSGEVLFRHNPKLVCRECDEETLNAASSEVENAPQAPVEEVVVAGDNEVASIQTDQVENSDQPETAVESTEDIAEEDELPPILYAPRVVSEQNAYIMRSMMREVVRRGTAVRAKALGRADIGGKTGTTNDQIDAWFSGFNDKVVTTSWVGFDNQQTLGRRETGGRAALPMWIKYMRIALDGLEETVEDQPDGLVTVRIDAETGKRASLDTVNSRFEIFRKNNEPEEKRIARSSNNQSNGSIGVANESIETSDEEIVDGLF
ncbi:MAG: penicillin-binding protein 1A [Gammaproteobacteria bacterium]|nr:penicillin-binding protein 1A [Gammaproteobacteria bacterium]